jgi:lysophospholipase L1-like esterase
MACIAVGSFLLGTLLTSPSSSSLLLSGGSVYGTPSSSSMLSLSSSTSTQPPTVPSKRHQILVYGDFLTSGVSGTRGNQLFPYAKYLEQALHQQTNGDTTRVSIHQVGLPSWTTKGMLKGLDGTKAGLRANINKHTDPDALSLVILLAGTNDVLQNKPPAAPVLEQNLQTLHQVCLDAGVPRTLAIGIPAAIVFHAQQATLVTTVNAALQQHFSSSTATTFVPFPLDTSSSSSSSSTTGSADTEPHQGYWHSNGMHLTESGYQRLGESLAPIVQRILTELDRPADQDGQDDEGDDGKQDDEGDDGKNEEGNGEDEGSENDP